MSAEWTRSVFARRSLDIEPVSGLIRESVLKVCSRFDDQYWPERDRTGEFPKDFCRALAEGGFMGIAVPEPYGGSGLGTTEAALGLQATSESGAANSGVSAVE